jgi:hypothetical protein
MSDIKVLISSRESRREGTREQGAAADGPRCGRADAPQANRSVSNCVTAPQMR